MERVKRNYHPDFVEYMKSIVSNENYYGLPITEKSDGSLTWVTPTNSSIGKARKSWAENKAQQLGFEIRPGVYAEVMRIIHPTKIHVCQICGSKMSIFYCYPSVNLLKSIRKKFNIEFTECDHISDIWDILVEDCAEEDEVINFMIEKFSISDMVEKNKTEIIIASELACRSGNKSLLSPGVMSNFPDRFDGFHSYNRCCRATEDRGRSKDNLRTYTKDRRAFEYWSDGNIHAANMFMGSVFFEGVSADHIGAISLGFVHDPRYLRPMPVGENSTKRDRLQTEDIENILYIEARTHVYPMSWYSSKIWEFIKTHYMAAPDKVSTIYRDGLKQIFTDYMFILHTILTKCDAAGERFLLRSFIEPKQDYFMHSYEFNEMGEIIMETPRHFTERSRNEIERFRRIAFEAVRDYSEKDNRHKVPDLSESELSSLSSICTEVTKGNDETALFSLRQLVDRIQDRIILKL